MEHGTVHQVADVRDRRDVTVDDRVLLAEGPHRERADLERVTGVHRPHATVVVAELFDDRPGSPDHEGVVRVEPGTDGLDVEVVGVLVGDEDGGGCADEVGGLGREHPGSMTSVVPSCSRTTVAWLYFVNSMSTTVQPCCTSDRGSR